MHEAGALGRGSVSLLVSTDEETGSERGLLPYIADGRLGRHDIAICAEPTALEPYLGNRGLVWLTVLIHGRAAHAGIPAAGRNPVAALSEILARLPTPKPPADLAQIFEIAPPSLTPTTLKGSDAVNVIPALATLGLDRRLVPGEDPHAAIDEIRQLVESVVAVHDGISVEIEVDKVWPPCAMEPDDPFAEAALEAARTVRTNAAFGFDEASNDASFLSEAGVPTLVWGPGAPELAHTADERIDLAEMAEAAQMYVDVLMRWAALAVREPTP